MTASGTRRRRPARDHLDRVGEQAEDALLFKAPFKHTDGFGMSLSCLGSLSGGAVLKEHQWADVVVKCKRTLF
jgi:hypothetical protein